MAGYNPGYHGDFYSASPVQWDADSGNKYNVEVFHNNQMRIEQPRSAMPSSSVSQQGDAMVMNFVFPDVDHGLGGSKMKHTNNDTKPYGDNTFDTCKLEYTDLGHHSGTNSNLDRQMVQMDYRQTQFAEPQVKTDDVDNESEASSEEEEEEGEEEESTSAPMNHDGGDSGMEGSISKPSSSLIERYAAESSHTAGDQDVSQSASSLSELTSQTETQQSAEMQPLPNTSSLPENSTTSSNSNDVVEPNPDTKDGAAQPAEQDKVVPDKNSPTLHSKKCLVNGTFTVYSCIHCRQKVPTLFQMKYHLLVCHDMTQICEQCGREIKTYTELINHQFDDLCTNMMRKCTVCGRVFSSPAELLRHLYIDESTNPDHHKSVPGPSGVKQGVKPAPRKKLVSTQQAKKSKQMTPKEIKEKEREMELWLAEKRAARAKMQQERRLLFGQETHQKQLLEELRTKAKQVRQQKKKDEAIFRRDPHIVLHKAMYAGDLSQAENFQCEQCGKKLKNKASFQNHMYLHTGLKPFQCKYCPKRFATRNHLVSHENCHEKPFVCTKCNKSFVSVHYLRKHMAAHEGVKPFYCATCGKGFFCKAYLKQHEFTHANGGMKPFPCQLCPANFMSPNGLHKHVMRVHTDIRPFKCTECDKSFSTESDFQDHMRRHNRQVMCELCGKLTVNESKMRLHKKQVHKIEIENVGRV